MKTNSIYYSVVLMLLMLTGMAQKNTEISYESFLDHVKKNNPIALKALNYSELANAQYQAARGNYDPVLNVSTENKFFNSIGYYNHVQGDIKQPLFTSQYLKLGYEYGNGPYINPENSTYAYGLPYVGLEVSLLQGLLFDKRRAEVLKARNYKEYYSAEQAMLLNNLLFESAQTYFDWLFIKKQYTLHTYFLSLASQRLKGIEDLANSGERPTVDTIEAAILLQSRLLDQQASLIETTKKRNELLALNWIARGTPSDSTTTFITVDSLDNYYQRAKKTLFLRLIEDSLNNPVIRQYKAKQSILEVEKRLKKEMIKPKLDVGYNFLSYNPNSYAPTFSSNNYKWAANLSFPLFFRNPRNDYKIAGINAFNNAYDLSAKENEIHLKINYLRQTVSVLSKQLQNAERSAIYSKLLVEAERLKFENGESSLFMLNTRENKWLETELKLAEYQLKFIKSLLNITYINGSLNYLF